MEKVGSTVLVTSLSVDGGSTGRDQVRQARKRALESRPYPFIEFKCNVSSDYLLNVWTEQLCAYVNFTDLHECTSLGENSLHCLCFPYRDVNTFWKL